MTKRLFLTYKEAQTLLGIKSNPYKPLKKIASLNKRTGGRVTLKEFCTYYSIPEEEALNILYPKKEEIKQHGH